MNESFPIPVQFYLDRVTGPAWAQPIVDEQTLLLLGERLPALAAGTELVLRFEEPTRSYARAGRVVSLADAPEGRVCTVALLPPCTLSPDEHALDMAQVRVDPACALRLPASMVLGRKVLPFAMLDGEVQVAAPGGRDHPAAATVERLLRQPARFWPVEARALDKAARAILGDSPSETSLESMPLTDQILLSAYLRQASDIHVNPSDGLLTVRFRVDGVLETFDELPMTVSTEVINRFKVMGGLDIAEKRAPQDGRFSYLLPGNAGQVEFRIATLPTKYGERLTLRILAAQTGSLPLGRLGFSPDQQQTLETFLRRSQGLMLMTGPTGSGKTTTLYAAIRLLLGERSTNIMTIEDPIEYTIGGISQCEVDTAEKVTFASALRSILRHDPDVVMVGEIRDGETANIAMKAAMTGHLVLGTLHTNSAAAAVTRLKDMGVDAFMVAATLRVAIAQRLSRRLCGFCRIPRQLTEEESLLLGDPALAGITVYEPGGCVYCAGRGYRGRVGLYEMLDMRADWAREVARGADESRLIELMREGQIEFLRDTALNKLTAGEIHISEALQVASSW